MNLRFLLLGLISFCCNISIAQDLPEIVPPSPVAQAMHKYGDYPTDHSTGAISMSIPIYTIQVGGYSLPIELKYHASGIKPTDINGTVGVGWTLHAGGRISQTIRGKDDFEYQERPNPTITDQLSISDYTTLWNTLDGGHDQQYDLFSMSLPGGVNGSFILEEEDATGHHVDAHMVSFQNYKIEEIHNTANPTSHQGSYYFKVTDDRGIEYYVGKYVDSNTYLSESNHTVTYQNGNPGISSTNAYSKLLADIVLPNGDAITYTYGGVKNQVHYLMAETFEEYYDDIYDEYTSYPPMESPNGLNPEIHSSYTESHYNQRLLTEITAPGVKVTFTYNASDELSLVKVYAVINGTDTLKEQVKVELKSDGTYRLLDKVSYQNTSGNTKNFYQLDYEPRKNMVYNTKGIDHWGYYNGKNSNTTLVASDWGPISMVSFSSPANWSVGGANRAPDGAYMDALMLKKMTFPTGGYTEFDYEPHNTGNSSSYLTGGLRIKQYRNYEKTGVLAFQKTYTYGLGAIQVPAISQNYTSERIKVDWWASSIGSPVKLHKKWRIRTFHANPLISNTRGSVVLYSQVTEYNGTVANHTGYTGYTYDIVNDETPLGQQYNSSDPSGVPFIVPNTDYSVTSIVISAPTSNGFFPFTKHQVWKSGQLLSSAQRDTSGNLVSKTDYTYDTFNKQEFESLIVSGRYFTWTDISNFTGWHSASTQYLEYNSHWSSLKTPFHFYRESITTGTKKPKTITTTTYNNDGSGQVSNIQTHSYNDLVHLYPSSTVTSSSTTGKDITTSYKYAFEDFSNSGLTFNQEQALDKLKDQNNIASPIETTQTISGNQISKTRTTYKDIDLSLDNQILPETIETLKGNGTLEDRIIYEEYDYNGNPLQVKKTDGPSISYIWGYGERYPVAKIENASHSSATGTLTSTELNAVKNGTYNEATMRSKLNKIRTGLPNAMVSTYTYDPLVGVTSMTDPKGYTIYYEYDEFNRLKQVKDANGNILSKNEYHYKGQQP